MINPTDRDGRPDLAGRVPLGGERRPLTDLVADLASGRQKLLREQLSGIHNPWGAGAAFTDPWRFLEVCEDSHVVDAVRRVLGDDIILWDSELFLDSALYVQAARLDGEGRYWPVEPLDGAIVLVMPQEPFPLLACLRQDRIAQDFDFSRLGHGPVLVIRYMSASSHFVRDPDHPAHRRCMEEQVLINYANRPLWLVSGKNRGNSDLVTGFAPPVPTWAKTVKPTA